MHAYWLLVQKMHVTCLGYLIATMCMLQGLVSHRHSSAIEL